MDNMYEKKYRCSACGYVEIINITVKQAHSVIAMTTHCPKCTSNGVASKTALQSVTCITEPTSEGETHDGHAL